MTEYENSARTGTGASRLRWRDGPRCDFVGEITCLMDIIGCLVGLGSIGCDANQIQFGKRSFIGGGAGNLHLYSHDTLSSVVLQYGTRVEHSGPTAKSHFLSRISDLPRGRSGLRQSLVRQ